MGGLAAKTFPWPTAIGNSQNVSPLTQSVAPTPNGPATQLSGTNGPSMTTPSTPPAAALPLQRTQSPFVPHSGPMNLQSPAFYAR